MSRHLIRQVYKIAAADPSLLPHAHAIRDYLIGEGGGRYHTASRRKKAVSKSTENLIKWALLRDEPLGRKDVLDIFERHYGMAPADPNKVYGPGDKLRKVGDRVVLNAASCKDEVALPIIKEFDGEVGTIISTEADSRDLMPEIPKERGRRGRRTYGDILVKLDSGPTIKIPRGQKRQGIGLKTPSKTGGAILEVVYTTIPGRVRTEEAMALAQEYIDRGMPGDFRSLQYFSGNAQGIAYNKKDGTLYFRATSQQRGNEYRTFNVDKGKVLYLGIQNTRPRGIEKELARLKALRG